MYPVNPVNPVKRWIFKALMLTGGPSRLDSNPVNPVTNADACRCGGGGLTGLLSWLTGLAERYPVTFAGDAAHQIANGASRTVAVMARVLGVPGSGFTRGGTGSPRSRRGRCRAATADPHDPRQFARDLRGTARHAELRAREEGHGRKRMRAGGLVGVSRRCGRVVITRRAER